MGFDFYFASALGCTPLLLLLSSSIAYAAELTPLLPGAPTYIDISVEKAYELIEGNPEEIILLDVRREREYNAEYIPGAITKISYSYNPLLHSPINKLSRTYPHAFSQLYEVES